MEETWFKRNAKGEQAEKEGRPDDAIDLYEANVAEDAPTLFSYERLAVLYEKRGRYEDEERVLLRAVTLLRKKERKGKLDSYQEKQLAELRRRLRVARKNRKHPPQPEGGEAEEPESDPWITALLVALIAAALAVGAVVLL